MKNMKNRRSRLGLSILAGGLSFVGAASATDLILNGNFALPSDGSGNYGQYCGPFSGNLCTGGTSSCAQGFGWQSFLQYNFSQAYYDGPPIPASENPGNYYSFDQAAAWTAWYHFTTPQSEGGFISLNMAQYDASETVMLTDAVSAADIDANNGQYTFSAWLASYGNGANAPYPEQPFLVLQFFSTTENQPSGFIDTAVILDRGISDYAVQYADGTTSFPFDLSGDNNWIKYVATGWIPAGAREATVFIGRSPNLGIGNPYSSCQTYMDLIKLDVTGVTPYVAPQSQTAAVGNSATFSVALSGSPTYQWQQNGTAIPGATGSTLVLQPVQPASAGSYTVVVNGSITSAPAVLTVINPQVSVTGQWDFLQGNLAASCGAALQYYDSGTSAITDFGTTTHYGIPNINGVATTVMHFTPTDTETGGYNLYHGAAPNGGGPNVEQYTLIYDVYYPDGSDYTWRTMWSLDQFYNSVWINDNDNMGAQLYEGVVTAGAWHRLAFAVDLTGTETGTAPTPVIAKFIDGVKVSNELLEIGNENSGSWDYSISGPYVSIFEDGWGDSSETYVSSVQFSNGRRPDGFIEALGGPSALKIPGLINASLNPDGSVTVTWSGGVSLESAPAVTGPWTTVAGTSGQSTYTSSPSGTALFYQPQIP
jgi:hypothetical protein